MPDKPARGELVVVSFNPQTNGPYRLLVNLDPREFHALGVATAQWALLEEQLSVSTKSLADFAGIELPKDATQDSFRRRLASFRSVLAKFEPTTAQNRFLEIADRIANANGLRQKLIHGLWTYDLEESSKLRVEVSRGKANSISRLDVAEIENFSDSVGELAFELRHPGGFDQFLEEKAAAGFGFSREFVRVMRGEKSPLDEMWDGLRSKDNKAS